MLYVFVSFLKIIKFYFFSKVCVLSVCIYVYVHMSVNMELS